jgi:hypothetical protein
VLDVGHDAAHNDDHIHNGDGEYAHVGHKAGVGERAEMDEREDAEHGDTKPRGRAERGDAHRRAGRLVANSGDGDIRFVALLEDFHVADLDGREIDGARANDVRVCHHHHKLSPPRAGVGAYAGTAVRSEVSIGTDRPRAAHPAKQQPAIDAANVSDATLDSDIRRDTHSASGLLDPANKSIQVGILAWRKSGGKG